ncbi:hypothetical protein SLS58_009492 [Diplodia intermedia]|uniref:Uncharacterized protein n=1 Tax=Diplodia intermedia TaxID=856260 RepID=A0ABR3TC12_9PEZI
MAPTNGSPAHSSASDAPTITGEAAQDIVLPVWGILVPPVAQDWVNAGFRVSFATNPATVKVWMVTENGLVEEDPRRPSTVEGQPSSPSAPANSSLRNQNISPGSEATPNIHTDNNDRSENENDKKNTDSGDTQESQDQITPSTRRMRKVPAAFARYAVATKTPTPMPSTHPRSPTPQPIAQPAEQQRPRPYSPFSSQLPPGTPINPVVGYRHHPHQPNPTVGTPSWIPSNTPLPRPSTTIPSSSSSAFHHPHVNRYNNNTNIINPSTTNAFPQLHHHPSLPSRPGRGNGGTFGPLDGSVVRANMTFAEWTARQAALPRDRYTEHPLYTGPPICQPWTPALQRELEMHMATGMYLNNNNNNFRGGGGGGGGRFGGRGGGGGRWN